MLSPKKKVLVVFGTRPEAIKMAPLVKEFQRNSETFDSRVCITAQHREMLDQVLAFFEIVPDYDLNIMRPNQNLYQLTSDVLLGMKSVYEDFAPDFVFVHGDTTTSTISALAAFYAGVKICHVEAGLRTYNKMAPFPEEINRQLTGRLADFHFAPTGRSRQNLLNEQVPTSQIIVTGNTVIDALMESVRKVNSPEFQHPEIASIRQLVGRCQKLILVTGHRRENFGDGFKRICQALLDICEADPAVQVIYPVHLNPNVREPVFSLLGSHPQIHLIDPLTYPAFVWLMDKATIIITDSGGIQEEAPSLGKPVLVLRDTTERPEAVDAGTVILVGTDKAKIVAEALNLIQNEERYKKMSILHNPYGDGKSSATIVHYLKTLNGEILAEPSLA
ncbi:non-hydrolyzing UDP-N-acetylglucosamine 2-epimerase [Chitinophaga rhizosphaerae]|uniref:non-hydrolyzing UDP-N-acetylglucosamine 2-epimerase n=1 Tax=Chitinophaga rhizosphaerae TaxID=1864947 RepID=UPI000F8120FF|nr:UDP-N-acetylglucosamine 2-epimerase (non-hydrolyzing) [Chitinophaga rhizosphaerae]